MPGTTTHNYILFKSLSAYAASSSLIKAVMESNSKVLEYAKSNKPKKYRTDQNCVLAGCAYVGCFGPDLFYIEFGKTGEFIADLMHYNKSGLFVIWCLRKVKQNLLAVEAGLRNDLLHLFAYCLGHICHIAADITVHPYVNSIVRAYPDNPKAFENARGTLKNNIWKFHNILEHYQDAYILHKRFRTAEGFGKDWETVNVARAAAHYYMQKGNVKERFLRDNCKDFYRFTKKYDDNLERDKYRFFESSNWFIDLSEYYGTVIPSEQTMEKAQIMVQGNRYDQDGDLLEAGLFDGYVTDAMAQTQAFWGEVEAYLKAPQENYDDDELTLDKACFRNLRQHWNLDCGIAPVVDASATNWAASHKQDTSVCIAGTLGFNSVHTDVKPDVRL